MIIQKSKSHSVRIDPSNPDHHLYLNNGTWYIHYTRHAPDYTVHRIRESLKTKDLRVARYRRDLYLNGLAMERGAA